MQYGRGNNFPLLLLLLPNCRNRHVLSSLRRCRNLVCPPVQFCRQQSDMRHHHHHPPPPPATKGTIPQRAARASLHPHIFAIATAVAVFVFTIGHRHRHRGRLQVGGVKPAQLLPVRARGGHHPPKATSPGGVAVAGGALAAVLLPARAELLPVRRGDTRA